MAETILVVDDSDAVRSLMADLLLATGFKVATACDGQQALDELGRCRPNLVLLDIEMPRLNGYEVCRRIKSDQETRTVPVMLVSGLSTSEDRMRGIEAGADDFMNKPFVVSELLARIGSLLRPQATPG